MRDYSKVSPQFWIGATGKKLRKAGIECQLVSLYLMTCSHANMLGLYYLPKMYIAHECGLTIEGASKGLKSSIEAGFCSYDDDSEMVWVHEMALYQIDTQLKEKDKRVLGVQNEYEALPECPFLKAFYDKYHAVFLMIKARGIKAPSKPLGSQEQEQEQKAGTGTGTGTGDMPPPAASAKQKGTRLSEDWVLPKSWGEWALSERPDMDADDIRKMAETFKDHWIANANRREGKKADWQATWRNWVRGQRKNHRASSKAEQIEAYNKQVAAEFLGDGSKVVEGEVVNA